MRAGVLAAACLARGAEAAVSADEVKALPGWDGALPSKHYSGCATRSPHPSRPPPPPLALPP
eukprot:COSAG04_NODE_3877_length_2455_cov_1.409593_1_plen_61_part_10